MLHTKKETKGRAFRQALRLILAWTVLVGALTRPIWSEAGVQVGTSSADVLIGRDDDNKADPHRGRPFPQVETIDHDRQRDMHWVVCQTPDSARP
jgi:hypothetical protein